MRISDWSSDVCSSDLALDDGLFDLEQQADRELQMPFGDEHDVVVQLGNDLARIGARLLDRDALGERVALARHVEIGRASCRERVCQYVLISVVAASLTKKIYNMK